jgi:hypothetical protein
MGMYSQAHAEQDAMRGNRASYLDLCAAQAEAAKAAAVELQAARDAMKASLAAGEVPQLTTTNRGGTGCNAWYLIEMRLSTGTITATFCVPNPEFESFFN